MCNSRMEGILVSAAIGQVFQEVSAVTKKTVPEVIRVFSSSAYEALDEALRALKPVIDEMGGCRVESLLPIDEFPAKFTRGVELVKQCQQTRFYELEKKFSHAKEINNMLEWIGKFIKNTLAPNMAMIALDLPCRLDNVASKIDQHIQETSELRRTAPNMAMIALDLTCRLDNVASKIDQHIQETSERRRTLFENSGVPNMPDFLVGLDRKLMQLEYHVLDTNVSLVGIIGSSGMGKSTLASALCHRGRIIDYFNRKVIYITVSRSPNIMSILMEMWKQIVDDGREPPFNNNDEAAHTQLQRQISSARNQPTLVVLDDVWSTSDLQKLLFNGEQYKTVVTTRHADIIREEPGAYPFPLSELQEGDALSLFCYYAFDKPKIPETHDTDLVKQVQIECKGLPVVLRAIGRSMRDKSDRIFWKSVKSKLSRGEAISPYHNELYERLKATCIDELEDKSKYFLDLAAFPEGRTISANALLDIWVYVHGMSWDNAYVLLHEFADRSLLTLNRDHWRPRIADGAYGLYFSQHDVMRDLALYLVKQDNEINCSRMCMPEKRDDIPADWQQVHASKAKIVSIHTGTVDGERRQQMDKKQRQQMDEERWGKLKFPKAEALVLYFTAEIGYCIPTFLGTMKKLKVLIINNYSGRRATLRGLDGFEDLSHLQSLQLERLRVPPLYRYFNFLKSLEKLSLSLCEGLNGMGKLDEDKFFNFPGLLEFNVDHCTDLEGLPKGICSSKYLKLLLVRNCHELLKLPDELGKLERLEVLSLSACASLEVLPHSIHKLQQLEILDISQCGSLKVFPDKFEELLRLKKLDMRECRKLPEFCRTLGKLGSLNHVICCEKNEKQLKSLRTVKVNLGLEVVEEKFGLEWLYDR